MNTTLSIYTQIEKITPVGSECVLLLVRGN